MQRYELDAWLGDDHGLTEDQIDDLLATADEVDERYPDPDDQDEREAALIAAYRLLTETPENLIDELAAARTAARTAEIKALAGLRQIAITRINNGDDTEAGYARRAGLDRMAVRKWLGKR